MNLTEALKVNGKVRQSFWNSYMYIRYEPNDFCGGKFLNEKGQAITLSPDSYLADSWEPYLEPCKHEPTEHGGIFNFTVAQCKHCKVNLKAVGWVNADAD